MSRWKTLAAVVLLVLWLPASMHCAMDRVGLLESEPGCCADKPAQAPHADQCGDRCVVLDGGIHKLGGELLKDPAPVLLLALDWFVSEVRESKAVRQISPPAADFPPVYSRTWQFVTRAALPPRAPSPVS